MSYIPGGEYNIPDSTAKSDWEAHNKKQEAWYQGVLAQFMQIAGGLMFDAEGNPVIDEATGKQKIDPDAAGAAITFFVMVLGQAMMEKQGSKIAESADKIAYMEAYLKAVTHLKQLFSEAESCTDPIEKARLTAQFNKELDNFLSKLGGDNQTRGPVFPKSEIMPDGTIRWTFEFDMRFIPHGSTFAIMEMVNAIKEDPRFQDRNFQWAVDNDGKYTFTMDDLSPEDIQYVLDTYGSFLVQESKMAVEPVPPDFLPENSNGQSETKFHCKDKAAGEALLALLRKAYPSDTDYYARVDEDGTVIMLNLTKDQVDAISKDSQYNIFFNEREKEAVVGGSWFDENTIKTLKDALEDIKKVLDDPKYKGDLSRVWDNSKAKDGKEPVDAGALKKFMNAFDTMGTTLSSISQAVQQEIQFDQGEFNKFLEIVHNMGSEVNKLLESINRKSGR